MSKNYLNQCPECKSQDIECKKKTGCLFFLLLIVFVVFLVINIALGLLMLVIILIVYPLLPKECTCQKCGLKWKA